MDNVKKYFELIKTSSENKKGDLKNRLIDSIEFQLICEDKVDVEWICSVLLKQTERICPDCGEANLVKKSVYTYICPECKSEFDIYCIGTPGEFNIAENLNFEIYDNGVYYRLIDFENEDGKGWVGRFSSISGEIIKRNINEFF